MRLTISASVAVLPDDKHACIAPELLYRFCVACADALATPSSPMDTPFSEQGHARRMSDSLAGDSNAAGSTHHGTSSSPTKSYYHGRASDQMDSYRTQCVRESASDRGCCCSPRPLQSRQLSNRALCSSQCSSLILIPHPHPSSLILILILILPPLPVALRQVSESRRSHEERDGKRSDAIEARNQRDKLCRPPQVGRWTPSCSGVMAAMEGAARIGKRRK